ncbi:chemotaxis protein CheA [Terasakiella sp. A23]|uniref:chemotaxis protein CheA n=1 Tax=Terasakiella sp. FCG-A23 TaxID=3080561 RepID=UPI0029551BB9|nr:chemotaxis protein CheA [Terasakiella sp. A23]MDV7338691.1 chemotaxis protein CheA [Terasakiella sp. A23]
MPQDFNLDQFKVTYFEECHELLASAEEHMSVLQAELADVDVEVLHAIFRCVHSIKGGAGAFNFTDLVSFSHIFESLLDKLREGDIQITEQLGETIIAANDVLAILVQMAEDDLEVDPSIWKSVANDLEALAENKPVETVVEKATAAAPKVTDYNLTPEEEEEQGWGLFIDEDPPEALDTVAAPEDDFSPTYRIKFIPESHLLRFANEPLLLARELGTLGKCVSKADISRLPDLDQINSDEAYLSWTFELESDCSKKDVEEVFEFVVDDAELVIEKITTGEKVAETSVEPAPKEKAKRKPRAKKKKEEPIAAPKVEETPPVLAIGEAKSVEEPAKAPVVQPEPKNAVEAKPAAKDEPKVSLSGAGKISSIRVELDRVDRLVNMVGELVISQAMLKQQVEDLQQGAGAMMAQRFDDLSAHTRELQESVMAIRMQPVKSVFARIPRLVRELSGKLDKKIDLITHGEMTEVDKTVIEQLMDPLIHMIRNSVDHGIETQEERALTDKPERASITLSAEHRSGRIQIEIADDGKGINRERVVQKAIEKGLLPEDHDLSDEEIDNLIFAPGFSTAEEVSDVSGRGVGMDVVRRNIVSLGGRISVYSEPGVGTRFLMSLPLTLAVLDGMIVKCGDEKYIIPLTAIIESIHPTEEELQPLMNGGVVASVRGEYIRIVNLYRLFNVRNAIKNPAEALVVIVETERFGYVGIMVDELLGQQQVVIKSLEENYDPIAGISAATILGNGKVSLILDVDGLAEMEHGAERRRSYKKLEQQVLLTGEQPHGYD